MWSHGHQIATKTPCPSNTRCIENMFYSDFLPNITNIDKLRENVKKALGEYCLYLKAKGKLVSCDPNSCRLCAGGCGNGYSVDGGAVAMDQNLPNFFMSYDMQCSGALQHNGYDQGGSFMLPNGN